MKLDKVQTNVRGELNQFKCEIMRDVKKEVSKLAGITSTGSTHALAALSWLCCCDGVTAAGTDAGFGCGEGAAGAGRRHACRSPQRRADVRGRRGATSKTMTVDRKIKSRPRACCLPGFQSAAFGKELFVAMPGKRAMPSAHKAFRLACTSDRIASTTAKLWRFV